MSKNRVWLAVIAVVVITSVATIVALTRTSVPANAAFVYGDRVVTKAELNSRIDALRALYGITAPKSKKARDEYRRSAAKSYAVTLILDQQGRDRGIKVSEKKTRDLLDRFIETQFGSRSAFLETLGNVGTSEREVLTEIRRQAVTLDLRKKIVGKVVISDSFLQSAFQQRQKQLATPERRRVLNVVVESQDEAEQIAQRLADGESIEAIAAAVSIDQSTRTKGGDLGYLAESQLEAKVGRAVFAVKKGQVYGPAQGSYGWNVGLVAGIRPSQPADFDTVKDELKLQLKQEQEQAKWSRWLAEIIRDADVHYAKDYEPADPDAPPPLTTSGTGAQQ
jgi:peptidyl-prolyl cis-trans isomerase C